MSRWVLVVVLLSLSPLVGCGPTVKDRLTGKWAGTLEVDQAALDKKIAEETGGNAIQGAMLKEMLKAIASGATFEVDLKADGTLSSHYKVALKDEHKTGTWAVKSSDGDKVTLTLVESGKPHDEQVTLTEGGFYMEARGENAGLGRMVFKKAP